MPLYDLAIFDLDGTLSDPLLGIGRSIDYALDHFGHKRREFADYAQFIGPPINQTFEFLTGTNEPDVIANLVAKFRERYSDIGYSENTIYPGITEALGNLHRAGVPMGVCTSKRVDFAVRIVGLFGLSEFFRFVDGGDVGIDKWQQLEGLRTQGIATSNSIMIGDRAVDLIAARRNGMHSAGVLWGYGAKAELENEMPCHLFGTPGEWSVLCAPETS